jgi:2,5-diketo-D-gluconate reductase A
VGTGAVSGKAELGATEDVELSADEMTAIDGFDTSKRGGPEPDDITLEAFGRDIPEA